MKKTFIFMLSLIGLIVFSQAQVSDNFTINPNDLRISRDGIYDIISTVDNTFTDEIGNPQLPIKIVSYVLPYSSTVFTDKNFTPLLVHQSIRPPSTFPIFLPVSIS
jgi:hypothetical protein